MTATFDWIVSAQCDPVLHEKIRKIILTKKTGDYRVMGSYRLSFNGTDETVTVRPVSPDVPFATKIIAMRLRYRAVIRMMNGEWEKVEPGDIIPEEEKYSKEPLLELL